MTEPPVAAAESSIEQAVVRLEDMLKGGQFAAALSGAEALLNEAPTNRDALYILAVSQRFLHRIPDALGTLARLERLHPNFTRLY